MPAMTILSEARYALFNSGIKAMVHTRAALRYLLRKTLLSHRHGQPRFYRRNQVDSEMKETRAPSQNIFEVCNLPREKAMIG